jgi:hypothetical protein
MSDVAPTTPPADKVTPVMSDPQANHAVAAALFNAVYSGLSDANEYSGAETLQMAHLQMENLDGDPAKPGVVKAMASMIDSHDPSLETLQGTVDRDKNGEVTGFTFGVPGKGSAYNQQLNADITAGYTLSQAEARENSPYVSFLQNEYEHGTVILDATEPKPGR